MRFLALIQQQKRYNRVKNEGLNKINQRIIVTPNTTYIDSSMYRYVFDVWGVKRGLYISASTC